MAKQPTVYYATGRRKTAAARVFMTKGSGAITINGKALEDFTKSESAKALLQSPFVVAEAKGEYDIRATVEGSGPAAQVGALRHGIARALVVADAEKYRPLLKKAGMMTRDSRMVERKKYGLHKARKKGQYSKR
jgi:small subunit ribosomal protein S9